MKRPKRISQKKKNEKTKKNLTGEIRSLIITFIIQKL